MPLHSDFPRSPHVVLAPGVRWLPSADVSDADKKSLLPPLVSQLREKVAAWRARNFLLSTPNIIVLDRIKKDFQGLRIFFDDPVIPDNGYNGRSWRDDFQLTLHLQDEVRVSKATGNIFLTNIHRVYADQNIPPSAEDENSMDYFIGKKQSGKTTDSKVGVGEIVRDIDELVVFNDEAHHLHDEKLAWFKSIEDIHHRLLQKGGSLSLQVDVTATPKHNDGKIFAQTVVDYPLVEAIAQNVVKHPVLPDAASRDKLREYPSSKFTEQYKDYLELGVAEWRKSYAEHQKTGKRAILFVMTDDTRNCDDVAEYLENTYSDLENGVLTIHTKNNGEISESSSNKNREELECLRRRANLIDDPRGTCKAIVSVLMLKEGWDVRNVTTIVGLRAYSAKSNILPEQTLGRGLRKMYKTAGEEYVSVLGTDAFMEFVQAIEAEGVTLERKPMGAGAAVARLLIEVDKDNIHKDIAALNIEIPRLTPRIWRDYSQLSALKIGAGEFEAIAYKTFSADARRNIVFKDLVSDEVSHTTVLDGAGALDYRNVIGYLARTLAHDMRLVNGYDVLYEKIKGFVRTQLFGQVVNLESTNTLRNLAELAAMKTVRVSFKKAINNLTVQDKGYVKIEESISLYQTKSFMVNHQDSVTAKKSVFNRIIGDSHLELRFAGFLENCADVASFAKNYLSLNFKLDYVNAEGDISNYYPDFIVKLKNQRVVIVETKGLEDVDVPLKMARLEQWCLDANAVQPATHDFVYVGEREFDEYKPRSFTELMENFRRFKGG